MEIVRQYMWHVFDWDRIPVWIGWTSPLVALLITVRWSQSGLLASISYALMFLIVMLLHEAGHAAMARFRGMPVVRIELHGFHGACYTNVAEASHLDLAFLAWGGVVAQLVLAFFAWTFFLLVGPTGVTIFDVAIRFLTGTNIVLALVNLLPIPGFDGATAWKGLPLIWAWMKGNKNPRSAPRRLTPRSTPSLRHPNRGNTPPGNPKQGGGNRGKILPWGKGGDA